MLRAAARWPSGPRSGLRPGPAVLALALGFGIGRAGLRLVQPQLLEDGGPIEFLSELALLLCLFCVGLRLQAPFVWSRWRIPVRLATLSMLATLILGAAAAMLLFGVNFLEALLLASILAPTDPVLGSDAVADTPAAEPYALGGSLSGGLAVAVVVLVLGLMGVEDKTSTSFGMLVLGALWSVGGGIVIGWLIGLGMARWIALMDFDRQTDILETIVVFSTAVLAFVGAEAVHSSGVFAVFAAGLALCHGGRLRAPVRRRPLAPRVLKIAGRVEKLSALAVVVLLGVVSAEMDLGLKVAAFAIIFLGLVRPLAVRLGLSGLVAATPQRRCLEWAGIRGAASFYCLVFAIDHGLAAPLAHELAGIALVVIAGSIVVYGATASPMQSASPGALSS